MASADKFRAGISGRKLTPVVILVLLGLCLCVAYFVTVVHFLQQARDRTHESWRQLAVQLDRDYRAVEQRVDAAPAENPPPQLLDFRSLAQAFRTEVDLTKQRVLADSVETALATLSSVTPGELARSETTLQMAAEYNTLLQYERQILTSTSGRMVRVFLVMPELPDFELSR